MNNNSQIEYQLEQTVAGKPEKKEPVILDNNRGIQLKAPWAPNKKCKRCYGRGFIGINTEINEMIPCRKCYPWK